jgi:hypothetical protein
LNLPNGQSAALLRKAKLANASGIRGALRERMEAPA